MNYDQWSVYIFAVRLTQELTMFTYGDRRKRQLATVSEFDCTSFDNCGDHSIVGPAPEDMVFTDEQRDFCQDDESCLYDLEVTGDKEMANLTRSASFDSSLQQAALSEEM